jgi:hypothetical protein
MAVNGINVCFVFQKLSSSLQIPVECSLNCKSKINGNSLGIFNKVYHDQIHSCQVQRCLLDVAFRIDPYSQANKRCNTFCVPIHCSLDRNQSNEQDLTQCHESR